MKKLILTLIIFIVSLSINASNGDSNVEYHTNGVIKSKVIKHEKFFEVIKYYETGAVEENEFFDLNKNKTGCWTRYSENGNIVGEANFKNDKKDGDWKLYNEKGQMFLYIKYKNGKKETLSTWNQEQGMVVR
jgi:antitoxin component YwqK of YwqJK toxin-antitoxin module